MSGHRFTKIIHRFSLGLLALPLLTACNDSLPEENNSTLPESCNIIHVGMVTEAPTTELTPTRANTDTEIIRAETVKWLQGALRAGLDITYSNKDAEGKHIVSNEHVAILKWNGTTHTDTDGTVRGEYTFKYKGTNPEEDAEWYDNGEHYFEGEYVPEKIRTTGEIPQDLTTDQHDESDYNYDASGTITGGNIGNYTLLSHYIGMPPNWTAEATVEQLLLPFKHRLARVIAYVLIDQALMTTLEGYNLIDGKDDPSTTNITFGFVKVLDKVREVAATATTAATLTPQWTEARKVVPHFLDEVSESIDKDGKEITSYIDKDGNEQSITNDAFIVYTDLRTKKKIHPREGQSWIDAYVSYSMNPNKTYSQQKYLRVPIYDIIVQPTYTSADMVMYDEEGYYNSDKTLNETKIQNYAKQTNSIEFELKLQTGLIYRKKVEFDLNANQQTVVYLTVDREGIDYDKSASETWEEMTRTDGYYGVDNDLGHNMSKVGSSWQRAVRFGSAPVNNVTDGNFYQDETVGDKSGQYFTESEKWIAEFVKATATGDRHGDYFVLDNPITIPARSLPEDFVFTGHLDGRGNTITIEGGDRKYLFDGLNATYTTNQENGTTPWQANVHKEDNSEIWLPYKGYRAEILNTTIVGGTFFPAGATFCQDQLFDNDGNLVSGYTVSGYIFNCFEGTNPIKNIVPIPKY